MNLDCKFRYVQLLIILI